MELYQLKTFVTVAEEGHLTRAADRLHTSQPSVSAHVKALEEELGVILFDRTPKGMRLTREGEAIRQQVEKALTSIDQIHQQATALKDEVTGTLRLGLHIDPAYLRVDALMSYLEEKHSKIGFHLYQRWSWEQPEDCKKDILDCGYVYGIPDCPGLGVIPLQKWNLVVAAPVAWEDRIAGADWADIAAMPWIWPRWECPFCPIVTNAFARRSLEPNRVAVADQEQVICTLVTAGKGLGFMIEHQALEVRSQGRIAIWDTVLDTVDLSFIYLKKREKEPLVAAVIEGVKAAWGLA